MSIISLGPVQFNLALNPQETSRSSESSFAVHPVLGVAPVREATGEGDTVFEISGVIFPHHFGGLPGLALLEQVRKSHLPIPYMRGNLFPVGWVLIEKLSHTSQDLDGHGVGMEITFEATLVSTGRPTSGFAVQILSLFL